MITRAEHDHFLAGVAHRGGTQFHDELIHADPSPNRYLMP
jgi:hypothetical protein